MNQNNMKLRTEKIASACVLLSSFLPSEHTLREEIEMYAVSLLADFARLSTLSVMERISAQEMYVRKIDHIVSCIHVAYIAGLISAADKKIISEELFSYTNDLVKNENIFSETHTNAILHPSFFNADETNDLRPIVLLNEKNNTTSVEIQKNTPQDMFKRTEIQKDTLGHKIKQNTSDKPKKTELKGQRKNYIIEFFKRKKGQKLTVKDISQAIPDCSEKTIQRELLSLVAEHVLKKEGERRWSTYEFRG